MLGRRIKAHQPPPTYLPELRRALLDEWCNIPQDQIDNLISSMPRRSLRQTCLYPAIEDNMTAARIREGKNHPDDGNQVKDLVGMYPLRMNVGSSDQEMELFQEDRVPGRPMALLRLKTGAFGLRLWRIVLRQRQKSWCQARDHWRTEWRSVELSDESRTCFHQIQCSVSSAVSDGHVLVRRKPGKRLQPNYLRPRSTPGVMVWREISYDNWSTVLVVPNTLTANLCVNLSIDMLHRPEKSPDLSLIEHVWDIIRWQLQHHPQPALFIPTPQLQ
ncbi:transposable element Tc1 transposase [Trichonephila clavipes]|nr:transposable element Tc1 transposase [Trichonephila clavipes]